MNIAVMGYVIDKLSLFYFQNFFTNGEKERELKGIEHLSQLYYVYIFSGKFGCESHPNNDFL
jgi:hypothetical protein